MRSSITPFSEIVDLAPDAAFAEAVLDLVNLFEAHINWVEFGKIPWRTAAGGLPKVCRDVLTIRRRGGYAFLRKSPAHDYFLNRLTSKLGSRSATVFRLLCLNEILDEEDLAPLLARDVIDEFVSRRVLIRRDRKITAAVRLVPYDDHFYLADSAHLEDQRSLYGIRPTYINFETHEQVTYLQRKLKSRRFARALEVGCGTGVISLELARFLGHREGTDLHERSIQFARVNQSIRRDRGATFYASDLFSNVAGRFDLIMFNPWQPSEESIGFVLGFLEQALARLDESGAVLLVLHSQLIKRRDVVFEAIAHALGRWGRRAVQSMMDSHLGPGHSLHSVSFLWIERRGPSTALDLRTVIPEWDAAYLGWTARRFYASARGA
jgi:SAM-dependent methyltransferase